MIPLIGLYSAATIETKVVSNAHCGFFFNATSDRDGLLQET